MSEVIMRVDLRTHDGIRESVRAGLKALLVQGRQIWEGNPTDRDPKTHRHDLHEIVIRLMKSVGDLAALARDGYRGDEAKAEWRREMQKELGNIILSTVRWIDDLELDPLECLELAVEAQEKFARSGRPR